MEEIILYLKFTRNYNNDDKVYHLEVRQTKSPKYSPAQNLMVSVVPKLRELLDWHRPIYGDVMERIEGEFAGLRSFTTLKQYYEIGTIQYRLASCNTENPDKEETIEPWSRNL